MKKIFSIFGPTGIGKSSLAIQLAKKIDGEIIGVDSRQIYNGIPIGTAQPNLSQLKEVPHHLIGFKKLNERISAGEYIELIDEKIDEKFWNTIRSNLETVEGVKQWSDIVFDSKLIEAEDKEYIKSAMELIPDDPWDENTWELWTSAIKEKTGRKGKELFLPLREAFTGMSHGPEMKFLIQLIGREKILGRVKT